MVLGYIIVPFIKATRSPAFSPWEADWVFDDDDDDEDDDDDDDDEDVVDDDDDDDVDDADAAVCTMAMRRDLMTSAAAPLVINHQSGTWRVRQYDK